MNDFFEGSNNFSNTGAANTALGQAMGVTEDATRISDDDLVRAYVGEKYDKIKSESFNIWGLLFKTFYLFYRKMFLYGILVFIIGIVASTFTGIGGLLLNVVVGLFVNKVYLDFAKKKVAKIKANNSQKTGIELRELCKEKGGVSPGGVFMGFLAEFGIIIVTIGLVLVLGFGSVIGGIFDFFKGIEVDMPEMDGNSNTTIVDGTTNENKNEGVTVEGNKKLVEDVSFGSSVCFNSKCTLYGGGGEYVCKTETGELLKMLSDYKDTVKLNIYYTEKNGTRTIVDYKVYNRDTKKELKGFKTENELRSLLGLATTGTHTLELIYVEPAGMGSSMVDGKTTRYSKYEFKDKSGKVYDMKHIETNGALELEKGKKYTVTFEVVEGFFGYENYITNVKLQSK